MLWHLYLRRGTVYVPMVARTQAGFYMEIEPVRSIPASNREALQSAIKDAISSGNASSPTPTRASFPKPVLLNSTKTKSWSEFEKEALCWKILERGGTYQIKPGRKHPE